MLVPRLQQLYSWLMRSVHFWAVVSIICGVNTVHSANDGPGGKYSAGSYYWEARNATIDALPAEIEKLALTLHNFGVLPLDTVTTSPEDVRTLEEVIFSAFPAFYWTDKIDNLICDLNPMICNRPRVPVSARDLADANKHVSGFRITARHRSTWGAFRGKSLILPRINFRNRANWVDFSVDEKGQPFDVKQVYLTKALGCLAEEAYDSPFLPLLDFADFKRHLSATDVFVDCAKLIANQHYDVWTKIIYQKQGANQEPTSGSSIDAYRNALNIIESLPDRATEKAWIELAIGVSGIYSGLSSLSGPLWLPIYSVFCEFPADFSNAYDADVRAIAGSNAWYNYINTMKRDVRTGILNDQLEVYFYDESTGDVGSGGSSPPAATSLQALANNEIYKRLSTGVFAHVNHQPDRSSEAETTKNKPTEVPHTIVVVDDEVPLTHCVFAGKCDATWVDLNDLDQPTDSQRAMFEAIRSELDELKAKSKRHGLGVAALAAAKPESGVIEGLDPKATVVPLPLDLKTWKTERFADKAQTLMRDNPGIYTVWNISGHTLERDKALPIYKFANDRRARDEQTIVVAAGNVSKSLLDSHLGSQECLMYPACGSLAYPNIIAVVGARIGEDGSPELWTNDVEQITSYGNPGFQIAAIAEGVVIPSATTNAFYTMDGTSYAAPQVAAVVSRLRAQLKHLPENIVARLIACGKQSTKLLPYVAGGLLDAECSLLTHKAQVAFDPIDGQDVDPSVAKNLRTGTLLGIWRDSKEKADVVDIGNGEDYDITGLHQWWARRGFPSFLGYRQLDDDPDSFKLVVWNKKGKIRTEVRDRLKSSHILEMAFDDDAGKVTCISVEDLIAFIPAANTMVSIGDHINANKSVCADSYNRNN